jgi:glycine cleavage system H protein
MSGEYLEITVDKFTFKVMRGCWYSKEGVWVAATGDVLRAGVTDFVQQTNGDMAFVEVVPAVGRTVAVGQDLCSLETVKAAIGLPSPVGGIVRTINAALERSPELVNEDPYGAGWLAEIEPADWDADRARLLLPEEYLETVRGQAEYEMTRR